MTSSPMFLNGKRSVAVVDDQWGDGGKGKIVDLLAPWADLIIRFNGGPNSGHTVVIDGVKHAQHTIPCGILYDSAGKTNVMGRGTTIYPLVLITELETLERGNCSYDHFYISKDAKLILPQHLVIDRISDAEDGITRIGTTGRGIGPSYADHVARCGLTINDLLNPDTFVRKLRKNLEKKRCFLTHVDREALREVLQHPYVGGGMFWSESNLFDVDAIVEQYRTWGERMSPLVTDTDELVRSADREGKRLLFEGAQGLLLDVDRGTRPFVSSSLASHHGIMPGSGLNHSVDHVISVVKAYTTRVGGGPFPTELGGKKSDEHCGASGMTEARELELFPNPYVNSSDEFEQGVALRRRGKEFGTTTSRPRRIGWLDLPLLKYAIQTNGPNLALMKLDVLDGCELIKICNRYNYTGPRYRVGDTYLEPNISILDVAEPDPEILGHCVPAYLQLDGWIQDTSHVTRSCDLPPECHEFLNKIQELTGTSIDIVSVGADRTQTIFRG